MTDLSSLIARLEKADEWRPVPGWPYEASNTGVLRNSRTKRVIKSTKTHNGYEKCTFQVENIRKSVRVHRAVAEAWHGAIPLGMQVNHVDGDKRNNTPSNLEIVTHAENIRHAVLNGLVPSGEKNGVRTHPERIARGERAARAKLTDSDVIRIRDARAQGAKLATLAATFLVDQSLISQICRRKIWTHI